MSFYISPNANAGAPFKARLESRIRFQTPNTAPTDPEQAEQRAVFVSVRRARARPPTTPTDKPLLDKPQGAIETTLNFLYKTQKDIAKLGKKLETATTAEQRTAIQSEIAAKTEELNAARSSKSLKDATNLLSNFKDRLAKARNSGERQAVKNEIIANRGVLGDRLTNLLTSANDKDIETILQNLYSALGTEITTKGAAVGAFVLFDSQELSEAGDQSAFNAAAEADKAGGGRGLPTREVYSLKFDTPQNISSSLAVLASINKSFEAIGSQLDTGSVSTGLSDAVKDEQKKEAITSPEKALLEANLLKTNLEGSTLLKLLDVSNDIDRERARALLAP